MIFRRKRNIVYLAAAALLLAAAAAFAVNAVSAPRTVPECTPEEGSGGGSPHAIRNAHAGILRDSKLMKRDPSGLELWSTPVRDFWAVAGNFDTLAIVLAQQEADLYGGPSMGVRRGDIVLDCGAHFGAYTQKALSRGASLVVAIEIDPLNIECLRRTFAPEIASGRVIVYPKGVWNK